MIKSLEKNKKISSKEIEEYFDDDKQMIILDRLIKGEGRRCSDK